MSICTWTWRWYVTTTQDNPKYSNIKQWWRQEGAELDLGDIGTPQLGDGATATPGPGKTITYTPGNRCDRYPSITQYTDTFTYSAVDTRDDNIAVEASVTVTVTCDNRAPEAQDDSASTNEDTPVDIPVLNNDDDPEDDPLEITRITDQPDNGDAQRKWWN